MLGSPGFGLPWPQVSLGYFFLYFFFESTIAPCHAESVEYSFACRSSRVAETERSIQWRLFWLLLAPSNFPARKSRLWA